MQVVAIVALMEGQELLWVTTGYKLLLEAESAKVQGATRGGGCYGYKQLHLQVKQSASELLHELLYIASIFTEAEQRAN